MHDKDDDVVDVYSAADIAEAYFLRDVLEDNGIVTRVVGDTLTGMLPAGEETAPRLWVHRADESRARELIAEYERVHQRPHSEDDQPEATWRCPTCGEEVEANLEMCWNCQTPRKPY